MKIKDEKTKELLLDFAVLVIELINNKANTKHETYKRIEEMCEIFTITTTTTIERK